MAWHTGRLTQVVLGACLGLGAACFTVSHRAEGRAGARMMLYDFTTLASLDGWQESSDTVRVPGMSKGAFVLQKTQLFQQAVLFSMLNPQPNGAGFVGFQNHDKWNLSTFSGIELKVRGQGENFVYKVNLKHKGQGNGTVSYEAFYQVSPRTWTTVFLPFSDFKPFYRGAEVPDAEPLDTANITTTTLQIVGGVYSDFKQSGTSSLELQHIEAVL